jgi:hypothetical protein
MTISFFNVVGLGLQLLYSIRFFLSFLDEADVEQSVVDFFSHHDVIQSEDDVWLQ